MQDELEAMKKTLAEQNLELEAAKKAMSEQQQVIDDVKHVLPPKHELQTMKIMLVDQRK